MNKTRILFILGGILAVLVLAIAAGVFYLFDATPANAANSVLNVFNFQEDDEDQPITGEALEKASSAALRHTGGGQVTGSEVGDEEGCYEVEVTTGSGQVDVHLDEDFNVIGQEADRDDAEDKEEAAEDSATEDAAEGEDTPITGTALDKAIAAALEYLGEGRVTGTEVGDEEGYYEIEVTLDDGSQVDVHLDENFDVIGQEDEGAEVEDD